MAIDTFTLSTQSYSILNLPYKVWDEENFDNELGDCLYFNVFQPGADLEKGANKLAQFKEILSDKGLPLSQGKVCAFMRILNLAEQVCEIGKQIAVTANLTTKEQLENQYAPLRKNLLDNAPTMTHRRIEWDWEDDQLKSIKEDAENAYPDNPEAQENYMDSLFCYKNLTL